MLYHCATASLRYGIHCATCWYFLAVSVATGRDIPAVSVINGWDFPAVSSYLPGFPSHICSYWVWDFPAVSVIPRGDFLALIFLARRNVKSLPPETRRPGFSGCSFSGMWNLKNSMCSRQIVLVLTGGFSVLNYGIFWWEAKTKRLFSQCYICRLKVFIACYF